MEWLLQSTHELMGRFEFVVVGGGLQAGLIALAILAHRRDARVAIVERGLTLGGNHTWCCHASDVPRAARAWLAPLVTYEWSGYDVAFPGLRRTFHSGYFAITSERFASVVAEATSRSPHSTCTLGRQAVRIGAHDIELDDGSTWSGDVVVDARGPTSPSMHCGYQKFLGLELELERAHDLQRPILIDATVPQHDGFRFFYVLPFEARRVLVEETYFSRSPWMDLDARRAAALEYAARIGSVKRVLREETGVLPMPWSSGVTAPTRSPLVAGYRGGWFHPATGYSLPVAARLACYLAERPVTEVFGPQLVRHHREHRRQARYAEHLNRLLFHGFAPTDMRNVFERFYALPEDLIARFNALSMTWWDRARVVVGRPPRGFSLRGSLAFAGST